MTEPASDKRLRDAAAALAVNALPGERCPATEEIWLAAGGQAPHERIRAIGLHTVDCSACAELWRLALEVRRDAGSAIEAPARRMPSALLAAASIAALLIVGAGLWQLRPGPEPVRTRAPEPDAAIISVLPDAGSLTRSVCRLRWRGPVGARYDAKVTTTDLRLLHEIDGLEAEELLVPAEALNELPDGARIVWVVTARLSDGRTVERAFFSELRSAP